MSHIIRLLSDSVDLLAESLRGQILTTCGGKAHKAPSKGSN